MNDLCAGRVAIVTGAGGGIGRAEALELARLGAKVVVNDIGTDVHGEGGASAPAQAVAAEIRSAGGDAIASVEDVADWEGAKRMVAAALDAFGDLHSLVNNAGILRDRTLVNMSEDEWDAVVRVHLRGTFAPLRHAAEYWRAKSRRGLRTEARVVNTTSASGLFGNIGQVNYGAAKAGVAGLTLAAAAELARYGVNVNAIAPLGLTRMTDGTPIAGGRGGDPTLPHPLAPEHVAPLVAWLASDAAADVTGRVFHVRGGYVAVAEGWTRGPSEQRDGPWIASEFSEIVPRLLSTAAPNETMDWGDADR